MRVSKHEINRFLLLSNVYYVRTNVSMRQQYILPNLEFLPHSKELLPKSFITVPTEVNDSNLTDPVETKLQKDLSISNRSPI